MSLFVDSVEVVHDERSFLDGGEDLSNSMGASVSHSSREGC